MFRVFFGSWQKTRTRTRRSGSPQKVRILDPDPEPQWTRSKYEAHSRTTRTSTLLNVGTVGIILLFKFRIAVGIRTVCGTTILVSLEGGHSEQITSRISLKLHCQFLFVDVNWRIVQEHFFFLSVSCIRKTLLSKSWYLITRMLLLSLLLCCIVVLPCSGDRRAPWKSRKKLSSEDLHTYNYFTLFSGATCTHSPTFRRGPLLQRKRCNFWTLPKSSYTNVYIF